MADTDEGDTPRPPPQTPSPSPSPPPPLRTPDLTDPVDVVRWGGELPSPRRLALSGMAATVVALGGNFLGVTSALLGRNPELAARLDLDVVVPVNGFKRCVDADNGYGACGAELPWLCGGARAGVCVSETRACVYERRH